MWKSSNQNVDFPDPYLLVESNMREVKLRKIAKNLSIYLMHTGYYILSLPMNLRIKSNKHL